MERSEEMALDTADHKSAKWLDVSEALWFGHMDQQDYNNFIISAASDLH
jgi:hypothetical protein